MRKLQVIKVENDTVQKADLQPGSNNISRSIGHGCDNKQIIKHALTINVSPEGEMTITPYQVSPCYVKQHGACNWRLVELGTSVPIKPGDICSLLQDRCWLKIIDSEIMEEIDNSLKRKIEEDTEEQRPNKKVRSVSSIDVLTPNNDNFKKVLSEDNINSNRMLEISFEKDTSEHNMAQGDNSADTQNLPSVTCEVFPDTSEDIEEQNKGLLSEQKNDLLTNYGINKDAGSDIPSDGTDLGETDQNLNQLSSTQQIQANLNPACHTQVARRDKCAYGNTCYRTNHYHKAKFSHPGDSDYNTPDDRSECSYGVRCYRKSVDHRAKYKHTSLGELRRKEVNRQKVTSNTTLNDYESSTEESIDESEYEPTDHSETSDDGNDDDDDDYVDNNENDNDEDYDDDDEYSNRDEDDEANDD